MGIAEGNRRGGAQSKGPPIGSPYTQQQYHLRLGSVTVLRSFPKEQAPISPPNPRPPEVGATVLLIVAIPWANNTIVVDCWNHVTGSERI
jgi:hypothetical protein